MSKYQSHFAADMESFAAFQTASRRWSKTVEKNLMRFDRFCSSKYPDEPALTQRMLDEWCTQSNNEKNNSARGRAGTVLNFLRYLRSRGKTSATEPALPRYERRTYIPHAFTAAELKLFFSACDNLPSWPRGKNVTYRKITVPVFFRLLYSSGIRTNEARQLRVEDVNLDQGILSIRCSKGDAQHFVALHDTMTDLLRKYNTEIHKIAPNRPYFFPSPYGSHYSTHWVCENFRVLWDLHNSSYASAYDLRHNYAIENINQWIGEGFNFDARLMYLSKSMGHSSLDSTRYYYSLVPAMVDIIENLSGKSFDDIVPEADYD